MEIFPNNKSKRLFEKPFVFHFHDTNFIKNQAKFRNFGQIPESVYQPYFDSKTVIVKLSNTYFWRIYRKFSNKGASPNKGAPSVF